jgi:hypothetical protein
MDCISCLLPMSGGKAENSSVFGRKDTGGRQEGAGNHRPNAGSGQGVGVGLDGAIGGPLGNGISDMAFVFWKAAISHLPACFRRVSV